MDYNNNNNLDLFSAPMVRPPCDLNFSVYIDVPGASYKTQHTFVKEGKFLSTVTREGNGTYVTFQVVVYLASGGDPTVKVTASSPGETDGHFDGSMSVLRSLSGSLVKTIEAGIAGAVSAPVETDGASDEQRAAALEAILILSPDPNSYRAKRFFDNCKSAGVAIVREDVFDGVYFTISSAGAFGGPPFGYKFGPSDWDPSLDFLLK